MIMDVPKLTHSAPLFYQCGMMPVQTHVKFRTVTMAYKTLHDLALPYMSNMSKMSHTCHPGQHDLSNLTSSMYLGETYVLPDGHFGTVEQYCTTP